MLDGDWLSQHNLILQLTRDASILAIILSMLAITMQACALNNESPKEIYTPTSPITETTLNYHIPKENDNPDVSHTTPPDLDLYQLTSSLGSKHPTPNSQTDRNKSTAFHKGQKDTFNVINVNNNTPFQIKATLIHVSAHAYWYVEDQLRISNKALLNSATLFENAIYPNIAEVFGKEWIPGIDNDHRLTILYGRLKGVAGYYSSSDEYPRYVHDLSNERKMIYINSTILPLDSTEYFSVLAHELQHVVHWNNDPGEETWVNEGLSQLAESISLNNPHHNPYTTELFKRNASTSLVLWPHEIHDSGPNYGASFLFIKYLTDHYGTKSDLKKFIQEPEDGINGINNYLKSFDHSSTFRTVFKDWIIANALDEPGDGKYSHLNIDFTVMPTDTIHNNGYYTFLNQQFAARYIEFKSTLPATITFQGNTHTPLVPTSYDNNSTFWWGNSGDSISTTLTGNFNLSNVSKATLTYKVLADIEKEWDYAYVQASLDDGITWDILNATHTVSKNPISIGFGNGYSGSIPLWTDDEVDLSNYAGHEILLRFHYITDQSMHGNGVFIDDISIPEIGFFDDQSTDTVWTANGFLQVNDTVPQSFNVFAITERLDNAPLNGTIKHDAVVLKDGTSYFVEEIKLDNNNFAEIKLHNSDEMKLRMIIVATIAPYTHQNATYSLNIN